MKSTRLASLGAIFSLMGTTALYADVTAEQVWESIQKTYADYGSVVTTEKSERSGDTLILSGLKVVTEQNQEEFNVQTRTEMAAEELRLRERGDGTVEITGADKITLATSSAVQAGEETVTTQMNMVMTQASAVAVASGSPEKIRYDITAPEMVVEGDMESSAEGDQPAMKLAATMTGTSGFYEVTQGEMTETLSDMSMSALKFSMEVSDPTASENFTMSGQMADLRTEGTSRMNLVPGKADFFSMMAGGAEVKGYVGYGASKFVIEGTAAEGPVYMESAAESGRIDVLLNGETFDYGVKSGPSTFSLSSPDVPFPIAGAMGDSEFRLAAPVAKSEEAAPYTAKLTMKDLTVSDDIWGLFDPTGQLPHDPATLIIDLTGSLRPLVDFFSEEMATLEGPPAELQSLDVNKVQLTLLGADLSGKGALTFDNTMGVPMPLGSITLDLTGSNALMEKLVAMGMVPQDQTMFVNMMLGLYANPAGDDAYTSTIEFNEGGEILANGQRIQ
ncbi:DUF2125 domain-containing protein [Sedimentimonas flavescens]|uniref:DUF2125 domain-containing protein n=1 Tax=Sedimentimonas flavescens TaxID=2851012 RepID=UPI001C4A1A87|nr:DUF2125 domain-containing protein [Sedimentimonas flavescens]MBW0158109.1 DUF2125 domain-containing protein [Sedimentimonas flavescens]